MANILDYVRWRGDVPLTMAPFNDADGLILSQLSYAWFDGAVPPDADPASGVKLREAARMLADEQANDTLRYARARTHPSQAAILEAMAGSARFGDMTLFGYRNLTGEDAQAQFAAVSFLTGDGHAYLSFRGTDGSFVGWKEDLYMTFTYPIPAQSLALSYLEEVAARFSGPLRLGGHSKGGNMAVYAASQCDSGVRGRVEAVYNHDGPGFVREVIESTGYREAIGRVRTIVPQSSVVGMLLEHEEEYVVVKSEKRSILQHDPFAWHILPDGLELADARDRYSMVVDGSIRDWIASFDPATRKKFVDGLYELLEATDAHSVQELTDSFRKNPIGLLSAWRGIDVGTRRLLFQVFGSLFKSVLKNLPIGLRAPRGERV